MLTSIKFEKNLGNQCRETVLKIADFLFFSIVHGMFVNKSVGQLIEGVSE